MKVTDKVEGFFVATKKISLKFISSKILYTYTNHKYTVIIAIEIFCVITKQKMYCFMKIIIYEVVR